MDHPAVNPYEKPLIILSVLTSGISVIFCVTMISRFILYKSLRDSIHKLFLCLFISDTVFFSSKILSISRLTNNNGTLNDNICSGQSILIVFSEINTILWLCFISIGLYKLLLNHNKKFNKKHICKILILVVASLILCILLYYYNLLQSKIIISETNLTIWCYFNNTISHEEKVNNKVAYIEKTNWYYMSYLIIIFLMLIICSVILYKVKGFLNRWSSEVKYKDDFNEEIMKNIVSSVKRLYKVCIIIILSYVLCLINRSIQIFIDDKQKMNITVTIMYGFQIPLVNLRPTFIYFCLDKRYYDFSFNCFKTKVKSNTIQGETESDLEARFN